MNVLRFKWACEARFVAFVNDAGRTAQAFGATKKLSFALVASWMAVATAQEPVLVLAWLTLAKDPESFEICMLTVPNLSKIILNISYDSGIVQKVGAIEC